LDFLIFLGVLFFVEIVSPEWTYAKICPMIVFAVKTFESMEAWLILFDYKIKGVSLEICFATPDKMSVILNIVIFITFNIL